MIYIKSSVVVVSLALLLTACAGGAYAPVK